ncbi:putative ATP-grasp superfamily ATP-dependent carboligase [Thermosporothrix hazakensis]|uniref:Putative ATP-grasp superfamily ATP-dependent carboligase n=1 Tax=Thermosporothrix hazakensis TaxID=644383 RepID=A0A326UTB9_THEHA|nr:ATP-grasp domain-containing protein [Thermosporothrix hazakensis]PZW35953.1 putative ATP-grasp superfamily ATP-dependent carboligase [Thermosporothrix hazakensis]GCE46609.1 hypothetical protein KTH_14780 [Thermosporothrix hazakensis]
MSQQHEMPLAVVLGSDFKALGVVRSLGRRGIPCAVVDNIPRSAWFSRYTRMRIRWGGYMGDERFLHFLLSLAKRPGFERAVLIPVQDEGVELIARHSGPLSRLYRLVTQDWDVIRWSSDKRLTDQLAREVGVPYPQTWYPRNERDLGMLDIPFPVIIKPAISVHLQYTLRRKALSAMTLDELRAQYQRAAAVIRADEIMVQELIPGPGREQYSVGAFCHEGRIVACMTVRRTRQYPIDYGLGSSFVEALENPELVALAEKLVRHMGVSGMVEIEFKYDARVRTYKLLDVNVRPWGWHALCPACGLDFSYMQYCAALDMPIEPVTPQYGYHWVRLLTDIPAGIQEVRQGLSTPFTYLRSLFGRTVFSVFDLNDPVPLPADFAIALMRRVFPRSFSGGFPVKGVLNEQAP